MSGLGPPVGLASSFGTPRRTRPRHHPPAGSRRASSSRPKVAAPPSTVPTINHSLPLIERPSVTGLDCDCQALLEHVLLCRVPLAFENELQLAVGRFGVVSRCRDVQL